MQTLTLNNIFITGNFACSPNKVLHTGKYSIFINGLTLGTFLPQGTALGLNKASIYKIGKLIWKEIVSFSKKGQAIFQKEGLISQIQVPISKIRRPFSKIGKIICKIEGPISKIVASICKIAALISKIGCSFSGIGKGISKIEAPISKIVAFICKIGASISKIGGSFSQIAIFFKVVSSVSLCNTENCPNHLFLIHNPKY